MKWSTPRLVIGCVMAVVVPAAVLHYTAADERLAVGLSAAPFAWPRVLVAHLVTALPLGLIVAGWLRSAPAVNSAASVLWVIVGAGAAGLAAVVCPALGEAISGGGFDAVPLLVMRAGIAFAVVLPWCVWATGAPEPGARPPAQPGVLFGLGAGVALLPCGLYAESVGAARTEQALDLIQRARIVRADVMLMGLVELGIDREIMGKTPANLRKEFATVLPRLKHDGTRAFPTNAPPMARLNRALLMIRLDRLGEAAVLLEPLAVDDNVALLLATVYRDQERWAESDELYSRVLETQLSRAAADPVARDASLKALEGLVFNARADRRPADAERVLKRGLEAFPAHAADFHFQLGRHYLDGGRSQLALDHLRESARRDRDKYGAPSDRLIREIRTATPGCLLWPSR